MAHSTRYGESPSDETRRKNSESNKAAWARRKAAMTTTNPAPTQQETLEPEPVLLDRNDVLDAVALFCSHFETLGERFKKQLRNTIRAIPPATRAAVAGPRGDAGAIYRAIRDWLKTHERLNRELEQGDIGDLADAVAKAIAATASPTPAESANFPVSPTPDDYSVKEDNLMTKNYDDYRAGMLRAAEMCRSEFKRAPEAAKGHDCVYTGGYEDACDHLSAVIAQAAVIDSVRIAGPQPDWQYHVSLLLPEGIEDVTLLKIYQVVEHELRTVAPAEKTRVEGEQSETSAPVVMAGRVVNISTHSEPTRARLQEIQTSVGNGYEREYQKSGWSKALQFAIRDLHFLLTFFRDDVTSAAPPESTLVAGEPHEFVDESKSVLCKTCGLIYSASIHHTTTSGSARRAAEEIANWMNWKKNIPQIAHEQNVVSLTNMLSKYFAAAPGDNDAESLLAKVIVIADIGSAEEFGDALERLKSIRQLIDTTTKGDR